MRTAVTSWTGTTDFALTRQFAADGAGSLLDLSSLSTVVRSGGSTNSHLNINATDGGRVDLSGLTAFTDNASGTNGRVRITANGANCVVDLGQVTSMAATDITVDETAMVEADQLTAFAGGTIILESTAASAADLHVANTFTLSDGAVVNVAGSTAVLVVGPGNSPGTLTVTGDYAQLDTAALAIEIGGTDPGVGFELLAVSGLATIAGIVEVSLWDAFVPNLGNSFVFLTAAAGIDRLFDGVSCTNCASAGVAFELLHGADFVSLTAVAAPIPVPAALWLLGSGLLALTWQHRKRVA